MTSRVYKILGIGLLLRLCVALWSGFIGPTPGADLDAVGLNGFAAAVGITGSFEEFRIGYVPYINVLGALYYYTISHIVVGNILSSLVWLLSAIFFFKSLCLLTENKHAINKALLLYSILPSSFMLTAVTLREPYQLLFVNIAMLAVLKIYFRNVVTQWFALICALVGAGLLHGALVAFGVLFFALSIVFVSMPRVRRVSWFRIFVIGLTSLSALILGGLIFNEYAYSLEGGVAKAIDSYQVGLLAIDARSNYRTGAEYLSISDLPTFIPISLVQYLFEPLPWHVASLGDLLLLLENLLRGWLIWKAARAWSKYRGEPFKNLRPLVFISLSYLLMELIWSLGAINWGTAVRHHIPAFGLLLLSAYGGSERQGRGGHVSRVHQKVVSIQL
jgi:hypothetical protein